ncbi:histone deacetylase family protein [Hyphomonas sp. NPDC076900]|uniref:histone deacetylase family protein n=1 Tax=unclassified Hyphomonas TaxID=2630699 RepID=UPI003D0735CB
MIVYFDPRQTFHAPLRELHNGEWVPYNEKPERVKHIAGQFPALEVPADQGMEPLLAVHDARYLEFLQTAHSQWLTAGRTGDAIGYTFPVVRRRIADLVRIDAKMGQFSFDASTPITADTWSAAYWSAQSAVAAVAHIQETGARSAFALCRPPGHHAGRDYMGGYCYLNNAAIAARHAQHLGRKRVAILDIDYHHGNGTQDIFYEDPGVLFVSIHANPQTDYPFYWGHADERGAGDSNLNLPLPHGTEIDAYLKTLGIALEAISRWGADFLVLSFGADTFEDDPISNFRILHKDFATLSQAIASLRLPTVIVMEGGYNVAALGDNVAAFIRAFD